MIVLATLGEHLDHSVAISILLENMRMKISLVTEMFSGMETLHSLEVMIGGRSVTFWSNSNKHASLLGLP